MKMAKIDKRSKRAKNKAKAGRIAKQKQIEKADDQPKMDSSSEKKLTDLFEEQAGDPIQHFGYDHNLSNCESPFDIPENGLVCMVSEVVKKTVQPLIEETGIAFDIGDWFVSATIEGHDHEVHGAFKSEEEALNFGKTECNVVAYRAAPVFEML